MEPDCMWGIEYLAKRLMVFCFKDRYCPYTVYVPFSKILLSFSLHVPAPLLALIGDVAPVRRPTIDDDHHGGPGGDREECLSHVKPRWLRRHLPTGSSWFLPFLKPIHRRQRGRRVNKFLVFFSHQRTECKHKHKAAVFMVSLMMFFFFSWLSQELSGINYYQSARLDDAKTIPGNFTPFTWCAIQCKTSSVFVLILTTESWFGCEGGIS